MRVPECHPERRHHAKGLCSSCHRRWLEQKRIDSVRTGERQIADRRVKDARDELTRFVYTDSTEKALRNYVELSPPPKQPMVVVSLVAHPHASFGGPMLHVSPYIEQKRFRAVRKAWDDGRGTVINWWDWEPC